MATTLITIIMDRVTTQIQKSIGEQAGRGTPARGTSNMRSNSTSSLSGDFTKFNDVLQMVPSIM